MDGLGGTLKDKMNQTIWKLRIFAVGQTGESYERALSLIEELAARRPILGEGPWIVSYPAGDATAAFASCERELDVIDPAWIEVLDFVAIPDPVRLVDVRGRASH